MAKSAAMHRVAAPKLGRIVFGFAALAFGVFVFISTTAHGHQTGVLVALLRKAVLYACALGLVAGGITIPWKATTRWGAGILFAAYFVYSLFLLPPIVSAPLVFAGWGDWFEQIAMVAAALILLSYPVLIGRMLFFLCVASFAAYQAVNPVYTATLVPKWIPPGQMFWVIATTVAFALAAIALFIRRVDAIAMYLLTLMLLLFQVLIWIPAVIAHPGSSGMWAENVQNFAIAASCWVVADVLSSRSWSRS